MGEEGWPEESLQVVDLGCLEVACSWEVEAQE
jgi:hypothetical protein